MFVTLPREQLQRAVPHRSLGELFQTLLDAGLILSYQLLPDKTVRIEYTPALELLVGELEQEA